MHYFLVYNDGTHNSYLKNLLQSVKQHGNEFQIVVFDKKDMDPSFVEKNKSILSLKRGGGYWLWKPYIINTMLNRINDGDILFYLDSKYFFTKNFTALYQDYMQNNDILVWKNKPNAPVFHEKNWCKMDVIQKYGMVGKYFGENKEACWAGAMIVKKTPLTLQYIQEWLDMCCIHEDITDSPSKSKNRPAFKEHRHDQALLGVVLNKYNIPTHHFGKNYLQNVRRPF